MIIFIKSGRLGNQIFQYLAMKKFDSKSKIIFIGADALLSIFPLEIKNIAKPRHEDSSLYKFFYRALSHSLPSILLFLSDSLHLISSVAEGRGASGSQFITKHGVFKRIIFFKQSYFQCEEISHTIFAKNLRIHQHLIEVARDKINQFSLQHEQLYFVHIRRGDFTLWPSVNSPAVVPLAWFTMQMSLIQTRCPNAKFLLFSNDKPYVEDFFHDHPACYLVDESEEIEFSMMSMCLGGGILSPSTFAWWAAFLGRANSHQATYVAPKYWIGHRSGKWYPPGIETNWINYE